MGATLYVDEKRKRFQCNAKNRFEKLMPNLQSAQFGKIRVLDDVHFYKKEHYLVETKGRKR